MARLCPAAFVGDEATPANVRSASAGPLVGFCRPAQLRTKSLAGPAGVRGLSGQASVAFPPQTWPRLIAGASFRVERHWWNAKRLRNGETRDARFGAGVIAGVGNSDAASTISAPSLADSPVCRRVECAVCRLPRPTSLDAEAGATLELLLRPTEGVPTRPSRRASSRRADGSRLSDDPP